MTTTFNQRSSGVSHGRGGRVDIAFAVAEFHRAFKLPMQQQSSVGKDR